ncbi:MAG: sensor histidine kinase [Flavitalea sp.]
MRFAFLFLLLLSTANIRAQQQTADSLEKILQYAKTDTAKAKALFKLSDFWSDKDSLKSASYLDVYAKNPVNKWYNALEKFYRGGALFSFDIYASQQAYMEAEKLLAAFETKEAYRFRARAWHNFGIGEQLQDREKEFVEILLSRYLPLVRKAGDASLESSAYMSLGLVMMNFGDYPRSASYLRRAAAIQDSLNNPNKPLVTNIYTTLAKTYLFQGDSASAKPVLAKAQQFVTVANDSSYYPDYYLAASRYHSFIGNREKAKIYLDSGQALAERLGMQYEAYTMEFERYRFLRDAGDYAAAKKVLLAMLNRKDIRSGSKNRIQIYLAMATLDSSLGNMREAFNWVNRYAELNDSLSLIKSRTEIAYMEARYKTAEQENQLLVLRNSNERKTLYIRLIIAVVIAVILFAIYFLFQRRKKYQQAALLVEKQRQLAISKAQLQGEETERNRLARDLHDGLGGMLSGIKLNLSELIHLKSSEGNPAALQTISKRVDQSVDELRRIARNLAPESILQYGIINSIEALCHRMKSDKLNISAQFIDVSDQLSSQAKLDIFRIVQELVVNAVKHSKASEILVQCSQSKDRFYITVEDNGCGFDTTAAVIKDGFGLHSVRKRVELLNGTMQLDSQPAQGTVINIEIDAEQNR